MKIKYFAWLQNKVGIAEEEITLPAAVTTVGALIEWLAARGPRYANAFEFVEIIKVAVNETVANNDDPVTNEDEVIFIPPIAGG